MAVKNSLEIIIKQGGFKRGGRISGRVLEANCSKQMSQCKKTIFRQMFLHKDSFLFFKIFNKKIKKWSLCFVTAVSLFVRVFPLVCLESDGCPHAFSKQHISRGLGLLVAQQHLAQAV